MPIYATAGSKVFVGLAKASKTTDFVAADFNGMSWVEVGWLENIGAFGDESSEITFDAIGQGRTQKLKGVRNAGNMELIAGVDYTDPGQIALRAAEATKDDYAMRVDFNDKPVGGTVPSKRYFVAKIMSARETLDGANNVTKLHAILGINSNVVRVAAS